MKYNLILNKGIKMSEKNTDLFGNPIITNPLLRDKFIEPPFSILDTKSGSWQKRKRLWKQIGIKSEVGRSAKAYNMSDWLDKKPTKSKMKMSDISIFDPALCEVLYHWFCKEGGSILDPFAGGSVRGIVANYLGYKYTGIDIRKEQIDSNKIQGLKILDKENQPTWLLGDSNVRLDTNLTPFQYDNGYFFKREDFAGFRGEKYSSGTKCRAYEKMILSNPNAEFLVVGCSADSMMQVYVAEMSIKHNIKCKIFVPGRQKRTELTEYCLSIGADVEEIPSPCYPVHYRKKAKEFSMGKNVIRWDSNVSTIDTMEQMSNLPDDVKRIIVPFGSGAVSIGIVAGLMQLKRDDVKLVFCKVSNAGRDLEEIKERASFVCGGLTNFPNIEIIQPVYDYGKKVYHKLNDGTELDYNYSGKAFEYFDKNKKQGDCLWISGRRAKLKINQNYIIDKQFDFIFSCPPYTDLEVYSDIPEDISTMDYPDFLKAYEEIIEKSCRRLKVGGYACFVVGEVRDKNGDYIGFVPDTISAFEKAGLYYYNEGILATSIASASMRAGGNMKSEKLVKIHQNILVFRKKLNKTDK